MSHYHVTENGQRGPQLASAAEAEAVLRDQVSDLIGEKRHQGAVTEVLGPLRGGGVVVSWGDEYLHGASVFQSAACVLEHGAGEPLMGVVAEVFAFAASEHGIWHLPGLDPLQSAPIPVSLGIGPATAGLLETFGVTGNLALMHGTSDRDEDGCAILTHAAVVDCPDPLHHWRDAVPVAWSLFDEVHAPPPHAPTEPPAEIRYIDVLLHALRHLAYHQMTDSDGRAAMPPLMAAHLSLLRPELFRRYERYQPQVA